MGSARPTMETYIEMSPQVFGDNLARANKLVDGLVGLYAEHGMGAIRFVASGSSYNSCMAARPFAEHILGVRVDVFTPSRYLDEIGRLERIEPDAFEVFVSQSGCSTNIIEAVRAAHARGHHTIALTGNSESNLSEEVDALFDYGVGNETVGFVTLGVITLMEYIALFALGAVVRSGSISEGARDEWMAQLGRIPELHRKIQRSTHVLMDANDATFLAPGHAFMCGSGAAYGIALEGALKWQETLKAPAIPLEPEEYIHGPNMQLTPLSIAFFIDPGSSAGRTYDIYRATRAVTDRAYLIAAYEDPSAGSDCNVIGVDAGIDELLAPFCLLPVVQLFAARAMRVLNCEPCHPLFDRFEQKVHCKTDDYNEQKKRKLVQAGFAAGDC